MSGQPAVAGVTVESQLAGEGFPRPIFILSAPRAGGSLVRDLLTASSRLWSIDRGSDSVIETVGELHPAARGWRSQRLTDLDYRPDLVANLHAGFTSALRNHASQSILDVAAEAHPGIRILDRSEASLLRVPFLTAAFPDAVFVFVHRDARQNVSSLIDAWRNVDLAGIPVLPGWQRGAWFGPLPEGWRDYDDASLVDLASFQWAAVNQRALDDLELLPRERWIDVDYAEAVAAPGTVAARIFALAALDVDEELSDAFVGPGPLGDRELPSPIKWRENSEFREEALARYNVLRGRLRELRGVPAAPPQRRSAHPTIRFSCFLDQAAAGPVGCTGKWIVNPSFRLQFGTTVPLDLVRRTRFRERFLADVPVAWVEDAATGVLQPFWVSVAVASNLRQFLAGAPPPAIVEGLGPQLAAAGILVTREQYERRREDGDALVEAARPTFTTQRHCLLPGLLHPSHVAALGTYYEALIAHGTWALGDAQVPQRFGWHNESVARYFHHQLTAFVGRVADEPVRPSYCYVSAYRGGRVSLRPHVDRKQCVFTVSLWIGEHSAGRTPWPLWLHAPAGVVSLSQSAGDAVLFRGCELPHWRDRPPPGGASTALILHYVPRDFVGVLD